MTNYGLFDPLSFGGVVFNESQTVLQNNNRLLQSPVSGTVLSILDKWAFLNLGIIFVLHFGAFFELFLNLKLIALTD
jgi:hypothetical protein